MIESKRGYPETSPLCIQMHVSHRLDPQISIQNPGGRCRRVPEDQDGRGSKNVPGNRVSGTKYPIRPRAYRDQLSTQVQYCEGGPDHQTEHGAGSVREVRIHQEAVLGTRRDMVGWIFREHSGLGRKDNPRVCQTSGTRRLRTSEACPLGIPGRKSGVGSIQNLFQWQGFRLKTRVITAGSC